MPDANDVTQPTVSDD